MDNLLADHTQLGMCTLLHNTTYWVACACKFTLCNCKRVTQDTIHHSKNRQVCANHNSVKQKGGPSWYLCLPPISLY